MNEYRLPDYLGHMREAATNARDFVDGIKKEDFLADKRTQQAVTKIMDRFPEFADRHPTIPWRSIRGMRNRIAHGYFEINLEVVWDTVETALPDLLGTLSGIEEK